MSDKNPQLERLYEAKSHEELMHAYEEWAPDYDAAMAEYHWRGPEEVLRVVRARLPPESVILDAGCGTGLMGAMLAAAGYVNIDGLDPSPGLLALAKEKKVYRRLHRAALGGPLDSPDEAYDAVLVVGVFTPGHASADSFDECLRITRRGGAIIFTLRDDRPPAGFAERQTALEGAGAWRLLERGEAFQSLPHGEPEVHHRVWAYRRL